MKQIKWFERKFIFDNNQNIFPSIIERLSGTPIRLEEKVNELTEKTLNFSHDNSWSIKENIGHLTDLEPLWQGRLEDIINNQIELRATDLLNTKTDLANHNDKSIQEILREFRELRTLTIESLQSINEETVFKSALHPRLKTPMRTMDLFLFVAEHDDHHLARITQLITLTK
ncbi:MAG: DinB family protein [Limnohabitans sp.]|nr:DinB family protein [Limnohabitans sp.]